ncbi:hypothetical protein BGZ75_009220 [Mortierella antarctica]|nr:hypothetical protein BGZ75_009220 [Mortierella antarctica]
MHDLERHRQLYLQHMQQAQRHMEQQAVGPNSVANQRVVHYQQQQQQQQQQILQVASYLTESAGAARPPAPHPSRHTAPSSRRLIGAPLPTTRASPIPHQGRGEPPYPPPALWRAHHQRRFSAASDPTPAPQRTPSTQKRAPSAPQTQTQASQQSGPRAENIASTRVSHPPESAPSNPVPEAAAGRREFIPVPDVPVLSEPVILPPIAPISVLHPPPSIHNGQDDDVAMEEGEDPIEVTLNIDIPKTPHSLGTEGIPRMTVLSVNPSWHCVFIETVQQERIRTSIKIQFCPSPASQTQSDHRNKVRRLQSLQVIGYGSRQVELTRRICGAQLLRQGGITVHLDPSAINYNGASYGFALSITSFATGTLCRGAGIGVRPDEPLPLARQRNSAYCRRNLKEMYHDMDSKDVAIALQSAPGDAAFYAHSVVLESYGHFRTLLINSAQVSASPGRFGNMNGVDGSSSHGPVIDEDGFAQPLHRHAPQHAQPPYHPGEHGRQRPVNHARTKLVLGGVSPKVLDAILYYMYMGHVPIVTAPSAEPRTQDDVESGIQAESSAGLTSAAATAAPPDPISSTTADSAAVPSISPSSSPLRSRSPTLPGPSAVRDVEDISSPATPGNQPEEGGELSWREMYETASQFQLQGLMHLSKLVLVSRLDTDLAVRELFEWAYRHWALVPSYVNFLIEEIDPALLRTDIETMELDADAAEGKLSMWPYREQCPRFNDIMVVFLQMLNERTGTRTLV